MTETTQRDIGRMEGKLDTVIAMQVTAAEERRATMLRVHAIEMRLASTEYTLMKIEPFARKAEQWEQRGLGVLAFAGMVGSALTFGIAVFKDKIVSFFS